VTELRELGDQGIVRFPARSRDFSVYQNVHTGSGAHLPPVQWVLGSYYPGEKRTDCQANHLPPPVVQVKDGVNTSRPHMSLWRAQELYLECLPVTRRHIPEDWLLYQHIEAQRMERVVCE